MATIIGAGNMAHGIGTRLAVGGASVTLIGRTPEKAQELATQLQAAAPSGVGVQAVPYGSPIQDDLVILAVPYAAEAEILATYRDQLAGKVLVEISNPLNSTYDDLAVPAGTSAAETVARLAPQSKVLKAFNTTFARTLVAGEVAGQPLDVYIAGDDADAKAQLAQLVHAGGQRPLDAGPLRRARQLEGLGLLHITQQARLETRFASAVKILA